MATKKEKVIDLKPKAEKITDEQLKNLQTVVNDNNAILAESYPTNVEDMANAYDNSIYSIYEKWYDTDINSLKSCMRNAYCLSENEIKSKQCHIDTNLFSYNKFCETIP